MRMRMLPEKHFNFDTLDWINHRLAGRAHLDSEQLSPILHFSLIWNLFETVACNRMASPTNIRRSVREAYDSDVLDVAKYQLYVEYFRERYLRNEPVQNIFTRLVMTNEESRRVVQMALVDGAGNAYDIVYALLLIAHRIRNNLFHGNKRLESLPAQTELFLAVNRLLSDYIEDIESLR